MKHTEVPRIIDNMKKGHVLEHGDKIVYATIRNNMNNKTRECFPAITTIAQKLQCSQNKIKAAIARLVEAKLIEKSNDGRKNHYYFPESDWDKQFDRFTDGFFELDMPLNIKEYYMDLQQYLLCDKDGVCLGLCNFPNRVIAERTGWTVPSVKKYNTWLIENGYLKEQVTDMTDEAGLPVIQKVFDLTALKQAELWARAVTQQVVQNTADIEDMKQKYDSEIDALHKKIEALEKAAALERNRVVEQNYTF